MSETKKLFKMGLSDVKEFMPDKPVTFDPPKMMFVWDDEDANDPETGAPYLAEVFYVNPGLGVKRVFAHGDGMSAKNMGATWDHCAETTGMGAKAIYAYLHGTKDKVDAFCGSTDCMRHEGSIVTYRELSEWLSRGKGQVMVARKMDGITPLQWGTSFSYTIDHDDVSVPCEGGVGVGERYVKVRKYGDANPADPTREYLGIIEDKKAELATYCNVVRWLSDHLCNMADATVSYGLDEVWITGKDGNTIKLTPAEVDYRKYTDKRSVIPSNMYTVSAMLTGCLLYDPAIRMDEYELVMNRVGYLDYLAGVLNNSIGKPSCSTVDWNSYVAKGDQ